MNQNIPLSTILYSDRFKLRIPSEDDIPFIFSATRHDGFNDGMQWDAPENESDLLKPLQDNIEAWKSGSGYTFTIECKKRNDLKGRISIRKAEAEKVWHVGFWTHPKEQGKGVMTEALAAVIEFGFKQLGALKIQSCYAIWNKASEKVMINNGMKFEKYIEQGLYKKGEWVPENQLEISKEEWQNSPGEPSVCDFCKILVNHDNALYEDDILVAMLDIDPISIGHIIICPKQHYTDLDGVPDEILAHIMAFAKRYIKVLKQRFHGDGFSIMANGGKHNDLSHFYLHVFPRNGKDGFDWTYPEDSHPDAKNFSMLKAYLSEAIKEI
jgi:ribosomal-protein-alanine N-acetyltransferase